MSCARRAISAAGDHAIPANSVSLAGKVTRAGVLKYLPSGVAVVETTLAVPQRQLERGSVGYFDVTFFGDLAEDIASSLRIGKLIQVSGTLWTRSYRSRGGSRVKETRVLVETIEKE